MTNNELQIKLTAIKYQSYLQRKAIARLSAANDKIELLIKQLKEND